MISIKCTAEKNVMIGRSREKCIRKSKDYNIPPKKNLCLILNCQYNVVVHFSLHIVFSLKENKRIFSIYQRVFKVWYFFSTSIKFSEGFKTKIFLVPTIKIIHNTISFYNWQKYSSYIIHSYISSGDIITCVDNIN